MLHLQASHLHTLYTITLNTMLGLYLILSSEKLPDVVSMLSKANFSQQAISWIEIVSRLNQVISSKLINLIEIFSKFAQTSNTPKFDWSCSHNSSYKVFVFFSPKEVFRKLSRLSFKDWCFTCSPGFLHHPLSWLWIPETKLSKIHFVSSFCELFMNIFWNMILKFQPFLKWGFVVRYLGSFQA